MVKTSSNGLKTSAALAGVGTGLGTLVIWLIHLAGLDLSPAASAAIAGGIATMTVYIVDHGILGFGRLMWRGRDYVEEKETKPATPKKKVR